MPWNKFYTSIKKVIIDHKFEVKQYQQILFHY